ncbi:WD40 repeat domain-containing protein [Blastochloris viridis]|nr:WD40 repeat domain-containing protein [Blastochloris viridis]ALK09667.1 WD domain, G-beta repeat [Blastochloris viridis]CUU42330.1 WD domain, G-beta repeat [Blastochloris viridis]
MSTEPNAPTPSVVDRVRVIEPGDAVVACAVLGETPVLALGEGELLFAGTEARRVTAHPGGVILAAASDGSRLLTGGDDGRVVETIADGTTRELFSGKAWVDTVALGPSGAAAWSAGKTVYALTGKGEPKTLVAPSTPGGIAFAPKGLRLAIAHYGGVTLWFPNASTKPERLEWKGSHLPVTWSPDGRFIVTAMHEPQLHGWRVADGANMRMAGYPGRVRQMSWTATGNGLASAGAQSLIVWPFTGKDGPMGKQPAIFASAASRISAVACHPATEITAIGFEDGLILLVRLSDGAEILVKPPGAGMVTALAWAARGSTLVYGTGGGAAGVLTL